MAKVEGRRHDETAQPASQRSGPERWLLAIVLIVAIAVMAGLLALAGLGR